MAGLTNGGRTAFAACVEGCIIGGPQAWRCGTQLQRSTVESGGRSGFRRAQVNPSRNPRLFGYQKLASRLMQYWLPKAFVRLDE